MKQILEGLKYLHENHDIMHRDIKPGNILMKKHRTIQNNSIKIHNMEILEEDKNKFEALNHDKSERGASAFKNAKQPFKYQIKICDFGLAKDSNRGIFDTGNEAGGTRLFQAPEQAMGMAYGKPVDVWAAGIIMYYLLTFGKHPINKRDFSLKISKVRI